MWSFSQNTLLYRFNVFSILTKHLPLHYACNSCNWRWDSKTSPFCLVPASQFLRRFILTIDLSNFSIWFVVVFSSPVIKSETFASLVVQLVKESSCSAGNLFDPWVRKIPWRRRQLLTPVFWLGEFRGWYSPWGRKESDTSEQLSLFFHLFPYSTLYLVDPNCQHHYSCALGLVK